MPMNWFLVEVFLPRSPLTLVKSGFDAVNPLFSVTLTTFKLVSDTQLPDILTLMEFTINILSIPETPKTILPSNVQIIVHVVHHVIAEKT